MAIKKHVARRKRYENEDEADLLTINEAAFAIRRSRMTIEKWYDWYYDPQWEKPVRTPKLPELIQEKKHRPYMIHVNDLKQLEAFREFIRGGAMAEYNYPHKKDKEPIRRKDGYKRKNRYAAQRKWKKTNDIVEYKKDFEEKTTYKGLEKQGKKPIEKVEVE